MIFLKNRDIKKIIENFSYLSVLQIFQMLIPIILYPYFIKVVGKGLYGTVIYAQTFVSYFVVLISFGFNMYGTKEIASNVDNNNKINEIVSSIYTIKLMLLLSSFLLLIIIYFSFSLEVKFILLFYSFLVCIGEFLTPIFFFQGIEKMKYITIVNLISRILFLVLTFLLIKQQEDYIYIPLLFSVGSIIGGIISFYFVFKIYKIKFIIQPVKTICYYFKKSMTFFINSMAIILTERTNIMLIGTFISMQEVAYYDLAVKIVQISKTPFSIIGQVLFPNFSKSFSKSKFIKSSILILIVSIIVVILLNIFSEYIIYILGGKEMMEAQKVLFILSISLPMVALSIIFGIALAARGFFKAFMYSDIIYFISYIFLVLGLLLMNILNIYTLSLVIVIGIIIGCLYKYYVLRKNNIL